MSSAGRDALKTLQRGSNLRKKWVNNTSATAAAQAPKTERLIRCRIEGSQVVLHYHHQVGASCLCCSLIVHESSSWYLHSSERSGDRKLRVDVLKHYVSKLVQF